MQQLKELSQDGRVVFLDYLRVVACFMVIMVHSCEFFFIDGSAIGIRSVSDGFWVSVIDSAFRSSVPLFVMASSYLLLPLRGSVESFFKRRFVRVLIPFIVWSLLYAILPWSWGEVSIVEMKDNLLQLLTNFNGASGHLWFIYMLIGLYMFMPILSPWLEKVSQRGEQIFLFVWFLTTLWPYLKYWSGDLYGECYWNEFHTFWYFSGFIGYLVLAHYIRTYINWSPRKSLCIGGGLFLVGYLFTSTVFYQQMFSATSLRELELSWRFCSFNIAFMAAGVFVILKNVSYSKAWLYGPIREISRLSYGIYLMHIFLLGFSYRLMDGLFSTPTTILLVGISTFCACCLLAKLLSLLPGSKYIIG